LNCTPLPLCFYLWRFEIFFVNLQGKIIANEQ
jgi:hypothetical protein